MNLEGRPRKLVLIKCDACKNYYRTAEGHNCKKRTPYGSTGYVTHTQVTRDILSTIQVGDLVKVNDWKKPMLVRGISDNYLVMTQENFGKTWYSVIEKKPRTDGNRNEMLQSCFHAGRDDLIFGDSEFGYRFDDAEAVKDYLQRFEDGINHLSVRNAIPIRRINVKAAKQKEDDDGEV